MLQIIHLAGFGGRVETNVVRNGGFSDTAHWSLGSNTTISGGVCSCTGATDFLQQNDVLESGVTYNYSFDWTTTASQHEGGGRLRIGCSGGTLDYTAFLNPSESGTFTGSFSGCASGDFVLQADQQVFHGTIDNIIVEKQ